MLLWKALLLPAKTTQNAMLVLHEGEELLRHNVRDNVRNQYNDDNN